MKRIYIVLFIALLAGNFHCLKAQTNYALFTVEASNTLCFDATGENLYSIEQDNHHFVLVKRNLPNGAIDKQFAKLKLPEETIAAMVLDEKRNQLLFTTYLNTESGKPYISALYAIDLKTERIAKLADLLEEKIWAHRLSVVNNWLSFESMKGNSLLYHLENRKIQALSDSKEFRLIFSASAYQGFVVGRMDEVAQKVEVYFMNDNLEITGILGYYNPDLVISSTEGENKTPSIEITASNYKWIEAAFYEGSYPASLFEVLQNTQLIAWKTNFDRNFEISSILAVNDTYVVAGATENAYVYNVKTPNLVKQPTLSDAENKEIVRYLKARKQYHFSPVKSEIIDQLFDVSFFDVAVEEPIGPDDKLQVDCRIAKMKEDCKVIKAPNDLTSFIKKDYKCVDSLSASLFQNFLDLFYPITSVFDAREKRFYFGTNQWIFIRGESFGKYHGYVVNCTEKGTVESIEYQSGIN